MSDLQTFVPSAMPKGLPGGRATNNPVRSYHASGNRLVSDLASGVAVGRWAWVDGDEASNAGSGAPAGFVDNLNVAKITSFRGDSTMLVLPGTNVTLMTGGDFYAITLTAATDKQAVFASNTTGETKTGAAGATIAGYTEVPGARVMGSANINEVVTFSYWSV